MVYFSKWKVSIILGIVVLGLAFAAPNLLDRKSADELPGWLPHEQVNLGLDLQGGSHLLLEVKASVVVRERLESLVDGVRIALRKDRIRYTGLGLRGKTVTFMVRKSSELEKARKLAQGIEDNLEILAEGNRVTVNFTQRALVEIEKSAVDQSIEIVRRRIDETGTREPTIQRQGRDRILVQVPGLDNPERLKRLLGKTAKMSFHLLDHKGSMSEAMQGRIPPGTMLLPSVEGGNQAQRYLVRKRVAVGGDRLIDSQPSFDSRTGEPIVNFRFDTLGGKKFGDVTKKNVNRPFAIVLDGKVISAPVIREPILGGSGQISGNFTISGAQDLALLLRAGALPAPLTILEERSVGPGLGADSIAAGKIASIIGLILVVVFMVITYGIFGVFADIALLVNMVLILGGLSLLQATLTLPGIAGIVLTIGMAVDANVLVFERIREEVRAGRTPISAIDAGYSRAITTIIDANLTTLIAALILFYFGSGPVRGFAVTLSIGIITSMFTAIMLTRLCVVAWIRNRRGTEVPI
ncbi:MAG: protein translocase subunit SecD [Rhodospirillaceae bacterium]|jgi:preprotein translocase subunit SecD|nr:protein translocase subunit SecD [Rhodospirillaceae bacterium]MBT4588655.1 protein translocase subunit SecD [Rhodospirillaceae bacterium]MBT4941054.1 protein translocase subunit SecD [Rhodospirillaceae bacterium]MBT5939898.1 protein translocase subunit SecD [Rhodospirillaceae bacterium]